MSNHVDGVGGVESVVRGLSAGLTARGHDVTLMGVRPAREDRQDLSGLPYRTGFLVPRPVPPPGQPGLTPEQRALDRTEADAALEQVLARHRDGILVCAQVWTMEHVADLGVERVMREGTRIIGQYHSSYRAAASGKDLRRLSATYRLIDKFLLLTEADAVRFRRASYHNTGWMPNALPFYPAEVEPERERLVVAIARYDENKQLHHALQAWARIAPVLPGWRFELYGEGPQRAALEQWIDDLGVRDSVALMGLTDDVEGVLGRARATVLCSRDEGLPLVLAESLACGVPAVSYDCAPGVRELLTHGVDGVVVRPDDIVGLAAGLQHVLEDEDRRQAMARAGRLSSARFRVDEVLDRWEDLFARVMR